MRSRHTGKEKEEAEGFEMDCTDTCWFLMVLRVLLESTNTLVNRSNVSDRSQNWMFCLGLKSFKILIKFRYTGRPGVPSVLFQFESRCCSCAC